MEEQVLKAAYLAYKNLLELACTLDVGTPKQKRAKHAMRLAKETFEKTCRIFGVEPKNYSRNFPKRGSKN